MSDWDVLDDQAGADGGVEYVGTVEVDEPASKVRAPRRPVRRVGATHGASAPVSQMASDEYDDKQLFYYQTAVGGQLAMNDEAVYNVMNSEPQDVGGHTAHRIQPGMYVTYGPSRGPSGYMSEGIGGSLGLGTNGGHEGAHQQAQQQEEQRDLSWIGGLTQGLSNLGVGIAREVRETREGRMEHALETERLRTEAQAEADAREIAYQESLLEHEREMQRLSSREIALQDLRREEEERAAEARDRMMRREPVATGTSPWVWIGLAVVGLGGVGGLVWYFMIRKGDEE